MFGPPPVRVLGLTLLIIEGLREASNMLMTSSPGVVAPDPYCAPDMFIHEGII